MKKTVVINRHTDKHIGGLFILLAAASAAKPDWKRIKKDKK